MTRIVSSFRRTSVLRLASLVIALGAAALAPRAQAQTNLYWDVNGATSGTGGTGTWNTTTTNKLWSPNATGAGTLVAWSNTGTDDNAFFGGTAGTVTVGSTVEVASITFSSTNYILSGSSTITMTGSTTTFDTGANAATINAPIGGSVILSKSGTGTLTLGGTNTYTGATAVTAGILSLTAAAAVNTSSGITVSNGASLQSAGSGMNVTRALTLNGAGYDPGTGGTGALRNLSGNNTFSGAITLATDSKIQSDAGTLTLNTIARSGSTNRALTLDGAGNVTVSGAIANTITNVTKNGTGNATVSAANNYTGTTTVNNGLLIVSGSGTLGATGTGTTVVNGATLALTTAATIGAEALSLNGTGYGGNGALRNLAGNNTYGGAITIAGASTITSDAGTLSLTNTIGSGSSFGLTFDGAGNINASSAIGNTISTLTKNGAGTVTLSSASNAYTGATTVNNGTLATSGTGKIGTGALVMNSTGTLSLANAQSVASITATGGTINGAGSLTLANDLVVTNTGANGLTIATSLAGTGGSRAITVTGTGNTTISNSLSNTISTLTKSGSGTLLLSGTGNAYTGATSVTGGTLAFSAATALPSASSINVASGGVAAANYAIDQTFLGKINSASTGVVALGAASSNNLNFSTGSLSNVSLGATGTYTYSGTLTPASSTYRLGGGGGSLTVSSQLTGANNLVIGGSGSSGTVVLSNTTNNYSGTTTVTSGTLNVNNGVLLSTGALNMNSGGTLNLLATGAGQGFASITGTGGTINGNLTVSSSMAISNSGASALNIGDPALKSFFVPSAHTAATDTGYITLNTGTTLTFSGSGNIVVTDRIRDTAGQSANWQYPNTPQPNYPNTPFSPFTNQPATVANAGSVVVDMSGGTVTYGANANSYTGNTTVKAGTLVLDTIDNQALVAHDPTNDSFHAINGNLTIGDAAGSTAAKVQLGSSSLSSFANEMIAMTVPVEINKNGTLYLNGNAQTLGALTFKNGGTINLNALDGSGASSHLYLSSDVNVTGSSSAVSSITGSTSYVSLTLHRNGTIDTFTPDSTRGFIVTSGGGTDDGSRFDFKIDAIVQKGGILKTGAGTMNLSNSLNDYSLATTVTNGILNVSGSTSGTTSALGSGNGTDANGTFVSGTGTLQMAGGITITNEKLNLAGTGYTATGGPNTGTLGALNNLSGNNTWGTAGSSYINLTADALIKSTAGTLTLHTNMSSNSNNTVTFGGAGTTMMDGFINTGNASAGVIKKDTGTLILAGDTSLSGSGYGGLTDIQNGVVQVLHNDALGGITSGTQVASGAELQINKTSPSTNITIGNEALTINGTGYNTNSGALRNIAGTNTYGGQVTLGGTSTIKGDAGTLLLTGGITGSNKALTVNTDSGATIIENGAVTTGSSTATAASSSGFKHAAGITSGATTTGTLTKTGAGTLKFGGGATSTLDGITLSVGNITVQDSGTFVKTGPINTASGTVLTINSGTVASTTGVATGGVEMYVPAGQTATFAGQLAGTGVLKFDGGSLTSTLSLTALDSLASTTYTNYTIGSLILNGGTLLLGNGTPSATGGVHLNITDTLYITGDTILDFNGSASTWLTSSKLAIAPGVSVTVKNWFGDGNSVNGSTVWRVNTDTGGVYSLTGGTANLTLGASDIVGNSPLDQISFTNWTGHSYTGLTTTWVSTNHNGWFDQEIRPTPEPSTYGLIILSSSLCLFGWRRYRNNRKKAA